MADAHSVVDLLERSGECLCGALARREEFSDIRVWYPEVAAEIESYERLATSHGHIEDRWAVRQRNVSRQQMRFDHPLCIGCESQ